MIVQDSPTEQSDPISSEEGASDFQDESLNTTDTEAQEDPFQNQEDPLENNEAESFDTSEPLEESTSLDPPLDESNLAGDDLNAAATSVEDQPPLEGDPPTEENKEEKQTAPPVKEPPKKEKPTLNDVKKFAEKVTPGKPPVKAAYPYSLLILGRLRPTDSEKLLDILERENYGITKKDLETQLDSGKILLPRISEYAGVLIIQNLRDCGANMKLGPSDQIFSTIDTKNSEGDFIQSDDQNSHAQAIYFGSDHPAEKIPILTGDHFSESEKNSTD